MPAPLLDTMEFVKWRLPQADLELLRAVHGHGKVNEVARALIAAYCARVRERGLPRAASTNSAPSEPEPQP